MQQVVYESILYTEPHTIINTNRLILLIQPFTIKLIID